METRPTSTPGTEDGRPPALLRVEQVAALLNVSRWFVYDHGEDLGLVKIGGANRYRMDRVEGYIARLPVRRLDPGSLRSRFEELAIALACIALPGLPQRGPRP